MLWPGDDSESLAKDANDTRTRRHWPHVLLVTCQMPISIKLIHDGGFTNTVCTHLYATMPTQSALLHCYKETGPCNYVYSLHCTEFFFDPAAEAVLMRPG